MSNRKSDTRGEKALGLFLDRFFYPHLCEIEGFTSTERIYDAENQRLGADLIIRNSAGATITIDEKAQLHYINNPKPTFALEVSYINEKTMDVSDGWFVSNSSKTDCYLLVWVDSARTTLVNRLVEEDFNEITAVLVTKKRIIQYLGRLGYSIERIKQCAHDLRDNDSTNAIELSPTVFLYYSNEGYDEKPINIVIDKKVLYTLAYGVYKVNREGCQKLLK